MTLASIVFMISMFDLLWVGNSEQILVLGPNMPESIHRFLVRITNSKCYIHDLHVQVALRAKFHKSWSTFQFWDQVFNFGSRSLIPNNIFKISMFDLFWVPNFIKTLQYCNFAHYNFETKSVQDPQLQIYLWLTNLTCSECKIS